MNNEQIQEKLLNAKEKSYQFLLSCKESPTSYKLTPNAPASPAALCFALFNYNLLGKLSQVLPHKNEIDETLRSNLLEYKNNRSNQADLSKDKPFLQLLCFTFSALNLLGTLKNKPIKSLVADLIPKNIEQDLTQSGAFKGKPQSGNQAMFKAILLLYAKNYLDVNTSSQITAWEQLHLKHMNKNGFWGQGPLNHLQFQNGYHQYEILNYLDTKVPNMISICKSIESLADSMGHFAPYPGGGGCYDLDAIYMITHKAIPDDMLNRKLLQKTFNQLISEQNPDGGFGENQFMRPRKITQGFKIAGRTLKSPNLSVMKERARLSLTFFLRSKNNRIPTPHWSSYAREWGESDLWDSWFRVKTLALIQKRLYPELDMSWNFIDFPGIGYHR